MDDAKSACPLMPWAAHVIQWSVQKDAIPQGGANPQNRPQYGSRSATDLVKPESLVILGQPYQGEYVLESCTHSKKCLAVMQSSPLKSDPGLERDPRSKRTVGKPRGLRQRVRVAKSSPPVEIQIMKCARPILVSDGEARLESFERMQGTECMMTQGDLIGNEIEKPMRSQLRHSTVRQVILAIIYAWEGQNRQSATSTLSGLRMARGASM